MAERLVNSIGVSKNACDIARVTQSDQKGRQCRPFFSWVAAASKDKVEGRSSGGGDSRSDVALTHHVPSPDVAAWEDVEVLDWI